MEFTLMRDTIAGDLAEGAAENAMPIDEESFRQTYERTARPLRAYLSNLTRDPQLAEDILQETYYRFCRAGAAYESDDHRRNALFRIATNLVRDQIRRRRGRIAVPLDEGPELPSADRDDQVQRKLDLRRALDSLDPRQRELLWLAYAEGESHAEIARICGVREPSVRTLLFRARRKVAAFLGRGGEVRS